jgi:hypothetical protein
MSKETHQFLEMIKAALVKVGEPVYVRLYCHTCHKFTAHQDTRYGSVCIFCGHTQEEKT